MAETGADRPDFQNRAYRTTVTDFFTCVGRAEALSHQDRKCTFAPVRHCRCLLFLGRILWRLSQWCRICFILHPEEPLMRLHFAVTHGPNVGTVRP